MRFSRFVTQVAASVGGVIQRNDWRKGSVMTSSSNQFLMPWLGETSEATIQRPSLSNLIKWSMSRKSPVIPPRGSFPLHRPTFGLSSAANNETRCTWIGHSTCLLQVNGINILTDAVFSERCSPMQWIGPKRLVPPACSVKDLPQVHVVLTSHNHYDHLDWQSIVDLETYHKPIYICGLKLGEWFRDTAGVQAERVKELDWWQSVSLFKDTISFQFVPVQHWSKRRPWGDERKTLWGGFAVATDKFKFFFNGDTGFHSELYEEIAKRCGPFDLAAIPIGAYEPRFIMKMQHVNAEEGYDIHRILKSSLSFGIHHSTFVLTDEPIDEPKKKIEALTKENPNVPPFWAIEHGASIVFDSNKKFRLCID